MRCVCACVQCADAWQSSVVHRRRCDCGCVARARATRRRRRTRRTKVARATRRRQTEGLTMRCVCAVCGVQMHVCLLWVVHRRRCDRGCVARARRRRRRRRTRRTKVARATRRRQTEGPTMRCVYACAAWLWLLCWMDELFGCFVLLQGMGERKATKERREGKRMKDKKGDTAASEGYNTDSGTEEVGLLPSGAGDGRRCWRFIFSTLQCLSALCACRCFLFALPGPAWAPPSHCMASGEGPPSPGS